MDELINRRIEENREQLYLVVKNNRPDLYELAVRIGEAAIINHGVTTEAAAEIEIGAMYLAAKAAGLTNLPQGVHDG